MTIDIAQIELAIESGRAKLVTGSHSSAINHIVETGNGTVFHKRYQSKKPPAGKSPDEIAEFQRMVYTMAGPAYIANAPLERHIEKEVRTVRAWNEGDIPSPKVLHYDGDKTIVYEYLDGHSLDSEFVGDLNERMFSRMLDCWGNVRERAKKKNDKDFLHSDPYADNFFYDETREIIVPIDPAKVVKTEMSFDEADARMNLLFLAKLFLLNTSGDNQAVYVNQTVDRFEGRTRGLMHELNVDPVEQRAYFARNPLPPKNILDIYFREDVRGVIQEALERKE